ncbi:MAG: phenylalanine 4-monooxygenase, partial [Bacteroidota bacterium]
PQLYVTPDFSHLMQVLEEFANTMSVRKGGYRGLQSLIDSRMVGTIEVSTGLQISGRFERMILNEDREIIFFKTTGPSALAYREKELIGHGVATHQDGFSSPIGKLKNISLAIEDMGPYDLKAYNFYDGEWLSFEFESGIKVEGQNVTGIRNVQGKLMLIQLTNCTVTYGEEVLFRPECGVYDLAIGKEVVSAFAGAADYLSFPNLYEPSQTLTKKPEKSAATLQLEGLYERVRTLRESASATDQELKTTLDVLRSKHPSDWLLALELRELAASTELQSEIDYYLQALAAQYPHKRHLITEGLELLQSTELA